MCSTHSHFPKALTPAIHKMSHVQDFYMFHIGTDFAKMHFGQISTNMKRVGLYVCAPHHHDTSLQDNDCTMKAFFYPSGMCFVALESLQTSQKRSTSTTIEMDLVTRMILRNCHLVQRAFPTSSHLQVLLTSARRS
jgi:hypothetical protein